MTDYIDASSTNLPNSLPRPAGEEEQLLEIWKTPTGWRLPTAINNTVIGMLYLGAAFVFLCLRATWRWSCALN